MRKIAPIALASILSVLPLQSRAVTGLLADELPVFSAETRTNLSIRGMGSSCLTITGSEDSLPCNPAVIAYERPSIFLAEASFGNGYKAISNTEKLLSGKANREFLKSLFDENQVLEAEANAEMLFMTKYFAASFNPYKVSYFSVIRNAANPVAAIHAVQDKSMIFMGGFKPTKGLYAGAQIRLVDRKFLRKEFTIYEALTDESGQVFKPSEQKLAFLEPGIFYEMESSWRPRFSLMVSNLGYVDQAFEEVPTSIMPQAGVGVRPPTKWGKLEFGIDYKEDSRFSFMEKVSTGVSYQFGAVQLVTGLGSRAMSAGVLYGMNPMRVGIVYSSTKTPFRDTEFWNQSVYTQFGFQM